MSDIAVLDTCGLTVVGQGTAAAADLASVRSRQRTALYADPLSWLVLSAVEQAVDGLGEEFLSVRADVGHIVVSDYCTTYTMRGIAAQLPTNRVSPLRFSGANPGSICSLPSQLIGFSGPSMTLSMPPEKGLSPAVAIARVWLCQRSAAYVLVTSHNAEASGHSVTSTILAQSRLEGLNEDRR